MEVLMRKVRLRQEQLQHSRAGPAAALQLQLQLQLSCAKRDVLHPHVSNQHHITNLLTAATVTVAAGLR
jgi:hypothetical protein